MILTNNLDLPQPLVDAIKNDGYTRGGSDYSVTMLMSPPRKVQLERIHANEITEDVSNRIWSIFGQAVHTILERASNSGIAERRLSIVIEGRTISGGMDAYYPMTHLLQDYKTSSVYKFLGDGIPLEYIQQLNCYAEMLRQNGDGITKLQIVALLRDWSKMEARRDPEYPQAQVITVDIPMWTPEETRKYMRTRVIAHEHAKEILPECTPEERWERPTKWAVMKKNAKKATKLHDNAESAEAQAAENPLYSVEVRPGLSVRCENYCSAKPFCSQYQRMSQNRPTGAGPAFENKEITHTETESATNDV